MTLRLAEKGLAQKEIAEELTIAKSTVKARLLCAKDKLGARNTTYAVSTAMAARLSWNAVCWNGLGCPEHAPGKHDARDRGMWTIMHDGPSQGTGGSEAWTGPLSNRVLFAVLRHGALRVTCG